MKTEKFLYSDATAEKELIELLKQDGYNEATFDRIYAYYFPLINYGLKMFVTDVHQTDLPAAVYTMLLYRKTEIKNRHSINRIIFQETMKVTARYKFLTTWLDFYFWIEDLKEIFYQIEKLPEEYKAVIRMKFENKSLEEIAKEIGIPQTEVVTLIEEGSSLLQASLAIRGPENAASTYSQVVYNQIFLNQ